MKAVKTKIKKGIALLLSYTLLAGMAPAVPSVVQAAPSDIAALEQSAENIGTTVRADDANIKIGTVIYDENQIAVQKDVNVEGNVALMVLFNDGTNDRYYNVPIIRTRLITKDEIEKVFKTQNITFSDCTIYLETTIDNVTYTKMAEATDPITTEKVTSVDITGMKPTGGETFPTAASCSTEGIATTAPAIVYTAQDSGTEVTEKADWNKTYQAEATLTTAISGTTVYLFENPVSVTADDGVRQDITLDPYGNLTVRKEFTTDKRKITGVAAPAVPTNNTFKNYYTADTILAGGKNSELGMQAELILEGHAVPAVVKADVRWTLANSGGAAYNDALGAENTFRWTVPATSFADYNASECKDAAGQICYDREADSITGTAAIRNKDTIDVKIDGRDARIDYSGADIDVSEYFTVDENAGTAEYSLVSKEDDAAVTGEGVLSGSRLTVTKTGVFRVKIATAAHGNYAAGEKTITLTVNNGKINYIATDYAETYDGQPHGIAVTVSEPAGSTVKYSTDGENYSDASPQFVKAGESVVYYKIEKENYDTVIGSKTVMIHKKDITITAEAQKAVWGAAIDQNKYTLPENSLAEGDCISGLILTADTTKLTENGVIAIGSIQIKDKNGTGEDVTDSYQITTVDGMLQVLHDTSLVPSRIEAAKAKKTYIAGDSLNLDDITVTAYYDDGYSETVTGFTANGAEIDMAVTGVKTLTVMYGPADKKLQADIDIKVEYHRGELILEPGKTIVREDGTISNNLDGTVTIDKGNDGTVDVTIRLPEAGGIHVDEDGKITVPPGGTVRTGDGKEILLPNGGTVDKDGNICADSTQTPVPTQKPTQTPTQKPAVSDSNQNVSPEEKEKKSEELDRGISMYWGGNKLTFVWKAVQGAEGYDIFAAPCAKKLGSKSLVKTVKGKKTSISLTKIAGKKISQKKSYKARIKAWKHIGGKKVYIGSSKPYHAAGKNNKKYTNVKKLKPAKKKYALKKGRSIRLKVQIVKQSNKKGLLSNAHGPALRYISGNRKVAAVTSNGKVKAKEKGSCYIYVTALNGVRTKIKITVLP